MHKHIVHVLPIITVCVFTEVLQFTVSHVIHIH